MPLMTLKNIIYSYHLICMFSTIALSIYSIIRYIKNEDVTFVKDTKFFDSKDAIYPSFSFCIDPSFSEDNFKMYGDDAINMTSYMQFLNGEIWDQRFLVVEYDNVSTSLENNYLGARIVTRRGVKKQTWDLNFYTSFRSSTQKCLTIDAPILNETVLYFAIDINNTIFSKDRRSKWVLMTYFHYPGQYFSGTFTLKYDYQKREKNETSTLMIETKNIEVTTKRNKLQEPCIEDWKHYDTYVVSSFENAVGCNPPNWKMNSKLPQCTNGS